MKFPRLFEPVSLGPIELRNRLMMTVHGGGTLDRVLPYFEARAAGGVGMMCVPGAGVGVEGFSPAPGAFMPGRVGDFDAVLPDPGSAAGIAYFDGRVIPPLRALADAAHRHGAKVVSQIYNLGTGSASGRLTPSIAPSAVRDGAEYVIPHALTVGEIQTLVAAFGQSARRVREAGLDGVEVHAAHGYLINLFLSPRTNHRTDQYGGGFGGRLRFLTEVLDAVSGNAGADFPVGLRINGTEMDAGGLTHDDVAAIVQAVEARLAYVSISGGNATGYQDGLSLAYASPWLVPAGHNAGPAAAIRKVLNLPVVLAGRVIDPSQAERLVAEGSCDVVGMARALLADPDWPNKARTGRADDIRPCIGCNECHAFHGGHGHMVCAVNPVATREDELDLAQTERPRYVLVIGGGPAGMQAALTASRRGHHVTLVERESQLGGLAALMARDPSRVLLERWLDYERRQIAAEPIDVCLGTIATPGLVADLHPAVIVLATGSVPLVPDFAGSDSTHVLSAADVLRGTHVGPRVVIAGGLEAHLPPLTLADLLARRGHEVTLLSELPAVGRAVEDRTLLQLLRRLLERDVQIVPLTKLLSFTGDAVSTAHVLTSATSTIGDVDTVVMACGQVAQDGLRSGLDELGVPVHLIGDCLSPRRIVHAMLEGARLGHVL